ncbi:hypothetical protein G6O67_001873 [Ophiocordyceps sinensis]|uniref:Uncharacterized protein n=2 Tax=Ophiocordyceps sinensis TaxID=72228 RepID=A0A8H4PT09_9HYPO|nr:hypothetical protein OCS_00952 [Ophiocordyceps sinensis CO18]KAF4509939.1 hypothetical protein G6O67_001873 [Ophiocordyceps sinensis]
MARNRRNIANGTVTRSSARSAIKPANAATADNAASSTEDDSDDGPSPSLVNRLLNASNNEDVGPKLLKDGNPYIYMRVPFGFPPWYVDSKAESSERLWNDLVHRHETMSARVGNMNVAMAQLETMESRVRPDGEDRLLFKKKIKDANNALDEFSDMRKGSPVLLSQKPIQLITFIEDSLWIAMGCLCRIVDAKLPRDVDGVDPEWEDRLRGLVESVAVESVAV